MAKMTVLMALAVGAMIFQHLEQPSLEAKGICAGPYEVWWVPGPHLDLIIQGENIETAPDGVWTTLTEVSSGTIAYLAYVPPDSPYTGVMIHNIAYSIWGIPSVPLTFGAEYLVQVWQGEYSVTIPDLSDLIAEVSVTMPATCYQIFLPMVFR